MTRMGQHSRLLAESRPPTARQLEVHAVMLEYQATHGLPPSMRELGDLLDISSTNGVTAFLVALERRGLVRHHAKGSARGWVALQPKPRNP